MSGNPITTDRQVAGLKPAAQRFAVRVAGARGLWLRVSTAGLKTFELQYLAPGGQHRRLKLGEYPHTGLAEAIRKAGAARNQIVDGGDPAGAKAARRTEAREGATLAEVFEHYLTAAKIGLHGGRRRPKKPDTLSVEESLFRTHARPKLGARKVADIKRADIRQFMTDLAANSGLAAPSVAKVGEILSSCFGFLVHTDVREDNPVAGLAHPISLKGTSRERRFDDAGIKALWETLCIHSEKGERRDEVSRLAAETCLALRFQLVTLARRGEVAGARWREIDRKAKLWEIPAPRTKSGRPHAVPLSKAALAIIDAAEARAGRSEFIFPAPSDPSKHIDERRMTRAVKRLCPRLGLPSGSPHDFRRSGASTLTGRLGFSRFHVGCVLGHQVRDGASVTAVYDRHDYLPEKKRALEAWAAHIVALAEGREQPRNVIEFSPAGA